MSEIQSGDKVQIVRGVSAGGEGIVLRIIPALRRAPQTAEIALSDGGVVFVAVTLLVRV